MNRHVLQRFNKLPVYVQRRLKHKQKKKWAKSEPEQSGPELALNYFDSFYKPVFGSLWPSIRIALLSRQKYGALLNNFVSTEDTVSNLLSEGAHNIVEQARSTEYSQAYYSRQRWLEEQLQKIADVEEKPLEEEQVATDVDGQDLSYFMPTKQVISEREELANMELQQGFLNVTNERSLHIFPDKHIKYPNLLKMFTHERGHIAMFEPASLANGGNLDYYLMDASSILPVVALDLRPGDKVLDMCAAPGGKTLAMLQSSLPGRLVCVENSYDRVRRLKDVLRLYTPPSMLQEKQVQVVHSNAVKFCEMIKHDMAFDKVLVDVPCYTDRHVLHQEENNLFLRSRQRERLNIQETQKKLLCAALNIVKPGGTVVYSTCTLSMPQNDGIVQAAIETIHQNTDQHIVIIDTSGIADKFRETFDFYKKCHYGQLVLPNLTANFGPMYFCKMVKCP